jgi:hypothetical protein
MSYPARVTTCEVLIDHIHQCLAIFEERYKEEKSRTDRLQKRILALEEKLGVQ